MAKKLVDDLHPEREGLQGAFFKMAFSRFTAQHTMVKAEFDISLETLKEIVGTMKIPWTVIIKDPTGKWIPNIEYQYSPEMGVTKQEGLN